MDTNKLPEGLLLNKTYSVGACLGEGGYLLLKLLNLWNQL